VPAALQTMIDLIDDEQPFHPGQADQPAVIDFYAREVLPKL
jgi:hypothetical protein